MSAPPPPGAGWQNWKLHERQGSVTPLPGAPPPRAYRGSPSEFAFGGILFCGLFGLVYAFCEHDRATEPARRAAYAAPIIKLADDFNRALKVLGVDPSDVRVLGYNESWDQLEIEFGISIRLLDKPRRLEMARNLWSAWQTQCKGKGDLYVSMAILDGRGNKIGGVSFGNVWVE